MEIPNRFNYFENFFLKIITFFFKTFAKLKEQRNCTANNQTIKIKNQENKSTNAYLILITE